VTARAPLSGPLSWQIAWRFLRHRQSRLLDGTARAAFFATALGVTAMVIAMALMTGYRQDLESKLLSGNAAVLAYPVALEDADRLLAPADETRLLALPGVRRVTSVSYGQGSLAREGRAPGGQSGAPGGQSESSVEVTLRGIEPEATAAGPLDASAAELGRDAAGLPGAVLGAELAHLLGVAPGDALRVVVLGFGDGTPRFRYGGARVVRTFTTGFSEFDRSWLVLDRAEVRRLTGGQGSTDVVEIALATASGTDDTGAVAAGVREVLGERFLISDARELNRELFTALALQKTLLFLALGLIVGVSTFNTASTLVVLVRERMRDLGVLATLGMAPAAVRRLFLVYGALLGSTGTAAGIALGATVSWALTRFRLIRFDPEVADIYFLSSVPFRVDAGDVLAVAAFSIGVTLLACLLPAALATRVGPAAALRYE
jgi:lipoprotein-releasing system permease protein